MLASVALMGTLVTVAAIAQSAGPPPLDLSWHSFDSGGGTSAGGGFELAGTIGQPDVGAPLSGGGFDMAGGFLPGTAVPVNTCPANAITTGASSMQVDADDLLAVISNWGECPRPCPPRCPADIAPFAGAGGGGPQQGDCAVEVADLLAVILNWGPCPE